MLGPLANIIVSIFSSSLLSATAGQCDAESGAKCSAGRLKLKFELFPIVGIDH